MALLESRLTIQSQTKMYFYNSLDVLFHVDVPWHRQLCYVYDVVFVVVVVVVAVLDVDVGGGGVDYSHRWF